ncbi:hypothetical protein ALC60_06166 [Trachymyrmex zeteki]|uniref:Uncharacterized protein n=1 Tax=Mycetomoellerius zeteki TaxID=64791 RepID=A0A151X326_9HYME|nr:hypothetical protein ALC60_06166 [Trachymyrmex zeteki]
MNSSFITGHSYITQVGSQCIISRCLPVTPTETISDNVCAPYSVIVNCIKDTHILSQKADPKHKKLSSRLMRILPRRLRGTCHARDLYPRDKSGNIGALAASYAYQESDDSWLPPLPS